MGGKWLMPAVSVVIHNADTLRSSGQHVEAPIRWLGMALIVVMTAALIYTAWVLVQGFRGTVLVSAPSWEKYVTPIVALIGMAAVSSLTPAQTPLGDPADGNSAVLNCTFTKLFGVFPVSVMGRQVYFIVFWAGVWAFPRSGKSLRKIYRGILALTIAGTLFSLYLTFLEVFVVRTACWRCLLSAATMTLLMIVTLDPALHGARRSRTLFLKGVDRKTGLLSNSRRGSNDRF